MWSYTRLELIYKIILKIPLFCCFYSLTRNLLITIYLIANKASHAETGSGAGETIWSLKMWILEHQILWFVHQVVILIFKAAQLYLHLRRLQIIITIFIPCSSPWGKRIRQAYVKHTSQLFVGRLHYSGPWICHCSIPQGTVESLLQNFCYNSSFQL